MGEESTTLSLSKYLLEQIGGESDTIVERNLGLGVPLLTTEVTRYFRSPDAEREALSRDALAMVEYSEQLITEIQNADIVVITAPIYNFSVPASLKAWADLVARAGITFKYTPNGPVGLMADRTTYIITASGGLPMDSPMNFCTPWLTWFLEFLGIKTVHTIAAEGTAKDLEGGISRGKAAIDAVNQNVTT